MPGVLVNFLRQHLRRSHHGSIWYCQITRTHGYRTIFNTKFADTSSVMKMPKRDKAGIGDQALVKKAAAVVKVVMKVARAECA